VLEQMLVGHLPPLQLPRRGRGARHPRRGLASERLSVAFPTANKLIDRFFELGMLTEVTGRRRNRVFSYILTSHSLRSRSRSTKPVFRRRKRREVRRPLKHEDARAVRSGGTVELVDEQVAQLVKRLASMGTRREGASAVRAGGAAMAHAA
jgi:hypothetical protein